MTKILPLALLLLAGISCKKDKKKDVPAGVPGSFTGKQVNGIVVIEYQGCGKGWMVQILNGVPVTVLTPNLPNEFKAQNKRITFVVGNKIVKDCDQYSSFLGERYEIKQVRAN